MIATVPSEQVHFGWHRWQLEYLKYFDMGLARFAMLEWHRRARKTTLAVNQLVRQAVKHAYCKYVYTSPTQVQTRNLVWDDPNMLENALPDKRMMDYKRNDTKMLVTFANHSMIKFGGSDKPDSLRGIDAIGDVNDEFSLMDPIVWTQIFSPIMSGEVKFQRKKSEGEITPDMRWALFLYTPKGINHATMMFNIAAHIEDEGKLPICGMPAKCRERWFASRLIADQSHIIPQEELDRMLQDVAKGIMTQADYDQEMQCKRLTDEERTLITSNMLDRLNTVNWDSLRIVQPEVRKIVSIDPAFGGDICALTAFENARILEKKRISWKVTCHEIVFEAKEMARRIGTKNFICDCIGNDVSSELARDVAKYHVQAFNSSEKCEDSDRFANKKAEAVEYAAQEIRQLKVEPIKDPETRRQLVALSRYKVANSGKMIMRHNDDTKKELGCSPDDGLSYVYGRYGLKRVRPEIRKETTYAGRRRKALGPMRM
ncbi:MAG: hypothetical protein V3U75_04235 [Methylococcaceae bacterium]